MGIYRGVRRASMGLAALTAAVMSVVATTPAQAALPAGSTIDVTGCAYLPGQIARGNVMHQYLADSVALYAAAYVPSGVQGGHFQIKGQYPKAGWFDWTTNNPSKEANVLGVLDDVNIAPDPGSTNPYQPGVNYDSNHNSYTINVKDAPVQQRTNATNVLWGGWSADPVLPDWFQKTNGDQLLYYIEGAADSSLQGGVPIPTISWVVDDPKTNPYQTQTQVCAAMSTVGLSTKVKWPINQVLDQYVWEPYETQALNLLGINLPVPLIFAPPSPNPAPTIWRPSPGGYWWENWNQQADYVAFAPSALYGNFLTIRFKAPTYDSVAQGTPRTGNEQTQFWSWVSTPFYSYDNLVEGSLNDSDLHPDANGYVTMVVSTTDQRPVVNGKPYADWLPWTGAGQMLFWQIVDPNPAAWPQSPGLLPQSPVWQHVPLVGDLVSGGVPSNVTAMKALMGDYYPVMHYCSKAKVEAGNFCQ